MCFENRHLSVPPEPFGPVYPDLGAGVAKYRKMAAHCGSVTAMEKAFSQAYGAAVEKAILAKQRSELQRELPEHRCNCTSGTNRNDGAAIHKAMQAKQRAALAACPSQERRARTPQVWQSMYDAAMADKRARLSLPLAA